MTLNEFTALCSDFMIDPSIALENEGIYNALVNKDYSGEDLKPIHREIVSYALEITWNDGTKEIRGDFPVIPYINEYLDELERND